MMRSLAAVAILAAAGSAQAASVEERPYGVLKDGTEVSQAVLRNDRGMEVRVIGLGAIITDIIVPDRRGKRENVAIGFGSLADYEARNADYYAGGVVGRYAGRIADARFVLDGKEVPLNANLPPHTLHGGPGGFIEKVWDIEPFQNGRHVGAHLTYISPAGEQGFPGTVHTRVTYTLQPDNGLRIDYAATTNAPTVLNLTNHSYFNLGGSGSGSVLDHQLRIDSDKVLEADAVGIPTGGSVSVQGTPFDFRTLKRVGTMQAMSHAQLGERGFNNSWLLDNDGELKSVALLRDPKSGRQMEVLTTEPSIHAYTAGYFPGTDRSPRGTLFKPYDAIALETQHYPDAPNQPDFPSTVLRPGEVYQSTTIYRFGVSR